MALESATYISDLVTTNPTASDVKSAGDDHLRLLKSTIKTTFPNVTGAVTMTHTQLNTVSSLAPLASPTFTGVPAGPTATAGTSTTQFATTAFVTAATLTTVLPGQTGNGGKFITTDGATAAWAYPFLPHTVVSGTTQTAAKGNCYLLTNVAATTVTAPSSPSNGDAFEVICLNSLITNAVDFGAQTVISFLGSATGSITLDLGEATFIYNSSLTKWVMT